MATTIHFRRHAWAIVVAALAAIPSAACGGKNGRPAPAELRVDSLPVDTTLPSLTDTEAQTLCSRWTDVLSTESARLSDKEGCLIEALQDSPDDVAGCETAFRECMSYDEGPSGSSTGDDGWCADFTAASFSGCKFTVGQAKACVDASVGAYEDLMRAASCAVYVPQGGLAALGAAMEAATQGADLAPCTGVDWVCDGGTLQGFLSFEDFGTD